ncbi:hypothetical protein ACFO5K_08095 [Nocardia halotolerans]|uniref:Uncharacterized protein n=1 Tax=Nocardia halotolerans TaxID=1755878 RepID=A0ABV8VG86_9NOCA
MIRILVTTAAVAGIAAGATSPAVAEPAQPAVIAESGSSGTGSALIDFPLGFLKVIICGPWASPEPHYIPMCR